MSLKATSYRISKRLAIRIVITTRSLAALLLITLQQLVHFFCDDTPEKTTYYIHPGASNLSGYQTRHGQEPKHRSSAIGIIISNNTKLNL